MKGLFIAIALLAGSVWGYAQTGKLRGTVADSISNAALELATVSVLKKDSSIIVYQLSDKNGQFVFDKLPLQEPLILAVSYVGYQQHFSSLQLRQGQTDTIRIGLSISKDLNAVTVTSRIPVRMNGDTLEINPAAFNMRADAVAEELLTQVAGIVIWSDGSITLNGKKVQNVFVDGKSFMGSTDPRMATQNLPKAAIDKIQLYQEYDRTKMGQQQQRQDSLLTMNIQLKEESKKGYFGKVGAGYGTRDRFESDLSFQVYNKRSTLGIGGGYNNINKNIGSVQEVFQNNTYRSGNPDLYRVGRFGTNGINKNYSVAGVFTHSFIPETNSRQKNWIDINYGFTGNNIYLTDLNLQTRTALNNPQYIRDEGITNNRSDRHDVNINYKKSNSYNDKLELSGIVRTNNDRGDMSRLTEIRDSLNQLQSTNQNNTISSRRSDYEKFNAVFSKQNEDKPQRSFSFQINTSRDAGISSRESAAIFESFTDASKNTSIRRNYAENYSKHNIILSFDYNGFKRLLLGRYNLFGIDLELNQLFSYSSDASNAVVKDFNAGLNQYTINANLTNRNKSEQFEYIPSLSLAKSFMKYASSNYKVFSVHLKLMEELKSDRNTSSLAQRNLNRNFQFFTQEGSLSYRIFKSGKYDYYLSTAYRKNFDYPSIDKLYTIVDDIDAYQIRVGNPQLQNQVNHSFNFNASFNLQNPQSPYTFITNLYGNYVYSRHPFADSVINDLSGKRTVYAVNMDNAANANVNLSLNLARSIHESRVELSYTGSARNGRLPNFVDSRYNTSVSRNISHSFDLQVSIRSVLTINAEQGFERYKVSQSAAGLNSFTNNNQTTKIGLVLTYPLNFSFGSTVERIDNSNINKPILLWNSFASYRFLNQQMEAKFSAMDLLKQYRNVINSVDAYGTSTRVTNGLQQYFLFTLSYYPRKFGKTVLKEKE